MGSVVAWVAALVAVAAAFAAAWQARLAKVQRIDAEQAQMRATSHVESLVRAEPLAPETPPELTA